jgi:hypothetical protein
MITQIQVTLADLRFSAQGLSISPLILNPGTTETNLLDRIARNQVGRVNTSY